MSEHCTYALLWKSPLFSTCTVLHFAVTFSSSFMSYVIDILFCICCHFNGCSLLEFTLTGFRICHYIACFIFAVIGLFISTILIYQRQQLVIHIYNIFTWVSCVSSTEEFLPAAVLVQFSCIILLPGSRILIWLKYWYLITKASGDNISSRHLEWFECSSRWQICQNYVQECSSIK